ncbi:PTS transporter subunit IIABC [Brachyspira hampsonii]|uniref:PTS system glucose subfamily transporter subunit IIA n=2 Tax=Brachyspira hampsonii TaxID=1287055 RepID=A0A2U4FJ70_9SPIR|nr:PTS transporter subunit IIABC [Brachyspira hampsonii]EKV57261.1 PTS system glucose subfamily transporter subunit IIA [Brachyspira hampsonii 30446]MBW5389423.1 PTS glucose transporter subunit IIA [Brachyspira hampsonii]OEJ17303.1 PTS glucose transporter subunit IIA [Brachyspira hampsonii]
MKDKIFGVLQRVGRSFMLPIAVLPVAGLFLGIGSSLTNTTMLETYNLMGILGPGTIAYDILSVLSEAGNIIFGNLPIIFAMSVAIGMAKKEKEVAALSGAIAFFVMHASIGKMITVMGGADKLLAGSTANVVGILSLQMGVFGGIIVGLGVAALHNKYYNIELPQVLSFFGGTRFVPIISSIVFLVVGILMYYVWPPVQVVMNKLGDLIAGSGYIGTLFYGIIERALIPFGLHHVFYTPLWQTSLGGTMMIDGNLVEGAQNIFFAQLGSPTTTAFSVEATRFMTGKFPFMIFGLPGAALAMYRTSRPEKKQVVGALLFSAALTAMLTGITEPIEFTFIFVAPIFYAIHCVLAGVSFMLMHILHVTVGMTFSGGFIDLLLFGIIQGNAKTNWIWIVIVGAVYFFVYYFLFSALIKKFDWKTPGREPDTEEPKLYRRSDVEAAKNAGKEGEASPASQYEEAPLITAGLGGKKNISDVDCCATRLRITVFDASKVDDALLKQSGAAGIIKKGNGIQVIYGPKVTVIKSRLEDYLHDPISDEEVSVNTANTAAETVKQEEKKEENKKSENKASSSSVDKVYSPIKGNIIKLESVKDEAFSSGAMGKGIAIEPTEGKVYAPYDGIIETAFPTKHAIGLTSDNGIELLIHVGMDTVQLGGAYFISHIEEGQKVKKGDLLLEFDIEKIRGAGYPTLTPVIVTNSDDYTEVTAVNVHSINVGDDLIEVKK